MTLSENIRNRLSEWGCFVSETESLENLSAAYYD